MSVKQIDKSYLTAYRGHGVSVPTRHIWEKYGPLTGFRVLDYGCGRGRDVQWLTERGVDVYGYDPYFAPKEPLGAFSVVLCHYVLNVIDPDFVFDVVSKVMTYVSKHGVAFFTVRRGKFKEGFTSIGTRQHFVVLPLDIELETPRLCIYKNVKTW